MSPSHRRDDLLYPVFIKAAIRFGCGLPVEESEWSSVKSLRDRNEFITASLFEVAAPSCARAGPTCGYHMAYRPPQLTFSAMGSGRSRFLTGQHLHLEGGLDRTLTLARPRGYERDALFIVTPNVMAVLLDFPPIVRSSFSMAGSSPTSVTDGSSGTIWASPPCSALQARAGTQNVDGQRAAHSG